MNMIVLSVQFASTDEVLTLNLILRDQVWEKRKTELDQIQNLCIGRREVKVQETALEIRIK